MSRVQNVMVGYDVSRTGSLTLGTASASSNLVEGEVIVLDKYGALLPAGATVADSDVIYIAVGGKSTFTEVNGYTRREMKISGPIHASGVKSYRGQSYTAATQRAATIAATGLTPSTTAGEYDYVIRIVYKDNRVANLTPAAFIQEYRVTSDATLTSLQVLYNTFRTKIAADTNARVVGSGTTTLILTGIADPSTSLTDIDEHFFVDFEVFFYKVILTGTTAGTYSIAGPAITYNTAVRGYGLWSMIRDIEKASKPYEGITNAITFPVPSGYNNYFTVVDKTYDTITIESNIPFKSSDMGYEKEGEIAVVIALPTNTQTSMTADVLAILNGWMASTPGAFNAVTL